MSLGPALPPVDFPFPPGISCYFVFEKLLSVVGAVRSPLVRIFEAVRGGGVDDLVVWVRFVVMRSCGRVVESDARFRSKKRVASEFCARLNRA